MELIVCKDEQEVILQANVWCREQINKTQAKSVYLPAGKTPLGLYADWERRQPEFLRELEFIQIDDLLTGYKRGLFKEFFTANLPSYVKNFTWIDAELKIADLAILGLGNNGHVAFHEPGFPKNFEMACVRLSSQTLEQLNLETDTWGVTYGVGAFMQCRAILMIATGPHKQKILQEMGAKELAQDEIPARWVSRHPHFTLLVDEAALINSGSI